MSREVAGKVFSSREELGLEPLGDEELAEAKKIFAQARADVSSTRPENRVPASRKFWDDTSGTELDPNRREGER